MKAWRRAQRGEDLTEQADEEAPFAESAIEHLSATAGYVRDPDDEPRTSIAGGRERSEPSDAATVSAAARGTSEDEPYSPFGKDARGSAPTAVADKPKKSTEAVLKSLTAALEKCDKALTPAVLEDFATVPPEVRKRFLTAIKNLSSKTAGLS